MRDAISPETRIWLERYAAGINDYRDSIAKRPADARTLGFSYDDEWTVEDILTLGRLVSVDVNWGRWLSILSNRGELGADDFVERLWRFGDQGEPSFGGSVRTDLSVLTDIGRTGSNALVVSGDRSASGGALVASDPHLGLPQPNIWCAIGVRTPKHNAIGLTIPGLPFILVGRNERIAWSGTNMQSTSSVLYKLPENWSQQETRTERIPVRWWFDSNKTVRESEFGPVLTDAKLLRFMDDGDLAFRWRGHEPSDEATSFYKLASAQDWNEFRQAFATYAVSGQNMLFADADGNIGQVMALEAIPAAANAGRAVAVPTDDPRFAWTKERPQHRTPRELQPRAGLPGIGQQHPDAVRATPHAAGKRQRTESDG